MSHDIRTPLNAIIGFTRLLRKNHDNEEHKEDYLTKIEESGRVLVSIINNVLEMSRIEKGIITLEETPTTAEQFNDAIYMVMNDMMKQKDINFVRTIDIRHQYVYSDVVKLREIFLNVLSNAYKYTPAGGTVTMALEELPCDREGYAL